MTGVAGLQILLETALRIINEAELFSLSERALHYEHGIPSSKIS